MPSPVVHIGYALGFGSLLMLSTKGSFTAVHCLILSLNAFIGPDIGSFLGWCFNLTFPQLADKAMSWIHYEIGYILIIAPIFAFISHRFSKTLNIKNCYLLCVAGCLLHFQIDHIFEENGRDKFYQWILSTGYFQKPTPPFSPFSVLIVGLSTLILFIGFTWIHLISSKISKQSLSVRLKYTFLLFVLVFTFYFVYLFISQIILEKIAVVGEEADLGVLIYIIIFHFLPFILCLISASD